ncbi:hypothetical protein AB6E06_22175 [Vibrio splendidus]
MSTHKKFTTKALDNLQVQAGLDLIQLTIHCLAFRALYIDIGLSELYTFFILFVIYLSMNLISVFLIYFDDYRYKKQQRQMRNKEGVKNQRSQDRHQLK